MSSESDRIDNLMLIIGVLGILTGAVIGWYSTYSVYNPRVNNALKSVDQKQSVITDLQPKYDQLVASWNQQQVDIQNGKYTTSTYEPYGYNQGTVRTGAVCAADHSYSSATGSGACSWHGGVLYWLY